MTMRDLDHDAPLVAQLLWAPASGSLDLASPSRLLALAPAHPSVAAAVWRWSGETRLVLPASVPAYAPLRLWARVAWPGEPAHARGVTPELSTVRRTWGHDDEDQPGDWSAPSPPVDVTAAEPRPAVQCSVSASPVSGTSVQVRLPAADPSSPGWRVVVTDARFGRLESRGPGPVVALQMPPTWTQPERWRVSVTCPDGAAGGMFDTHGFLVDPDLEPGDPPNGGR
jgi:hypothetical protein